VARYHIGDGPVCPVQDGRLPEEVCREGQDFPDHPVPQAVLRDRFPVSHNVYKEGPEDPDCGGKHGNHVQRYPGLLSTQIRSIKISEERLGTLPLPADQEPAIHTLR